MLILATEMGMHGAGWGPGPWWPIFPILWVIVVGALLVAVIRFRRGVHWQRSHPAEGVLAERYARGEIGVDEYRERLGVLKQSAS